MNGTQNRNGAPNGPRMHSAAPVEIDNRGQRQRARQYSNIQHGNKSQNHVATEQIKHKNYVQPTPKARLWRLPVLVGIIFLVFSVSLLAVYAGALLVKNARDNASIPTISDTAQTPDQTTDNDSTTTDSVTEDAPPASSKPTDIYAAITDTTVALGAEIGSSNAILIDLSEHTVLASKLSSEKIYPASMTKVMTLLVAVENMESLTQTATVTKATVNYCYNEGASIAGFSANETVTVRDLLYGTILPSGADATMTLAECISGSEQAFVSLMNEKARELGLTGTRFVNTSGLHDPNHYSTVHDIALILKAALENEICYKVLTASSYITSYTSQHPNGLPLHSIVHTRVSSVIISGVTVMGGKTGFTPEAGQCLATFAIANDGKEYIFVSANAPDRTIPITDAEHVYETYIKISNP